MSDRLITFYFGDAGDVYLRMAAVLEYTAVQHCPGWSIESYPLERQPIPHYRDCPDNFIWNVQKLDAWNRVVQEADEGDRLCILDCDTMITAPLDPVWRHKFDFAYTGKRGRLVLNCGVIFVRANARSRRFVQAWRDKSHEMIENLAAHQEWKRKSPGMTQPSMSAVLASDLARQTMILELSCHKWNCEESGWERFGDHVKILHIKGRLRQAVFGGAQSAKRLRLAGLAELWHETEARMSKAEGETA